jgi:predicted metal-dependent HD superfamily phosphohydrolase
LTSTDEIARARSRWRRLWAALDAPVVPESVFDDLVAAYAEPHRAYHRFDHVLDCLCVFDDFSRGAEHPSEVETAIWFHDAIYDPTRHDNEARSADWAVDVLRRALAGEADTGRVRELVLATRHDAPAATADQRLLLDVDLSILGRSPAEFQRYEDEIRREYAWVPEAIYHERRADLLEGFLRRDPLFLTPELRSRFEAQARTNLTASISEHRNRLAASRRAARP